MHKIMIIDDEENILKAIKRTLHHQSDWDVESYTNAQDALKRSYSCVFDVIISDFNMPGMNGIDFFQEFKQIQPDAIRILLTGMVTVDALMAAVNKAGAFRFITKPWNDNELIESIQDGIRLHDIIVENRMLAEKVRDQQAELDDVRSSIRSS